MDLVFLDPNFTFFGGVNHSAEKKDTMFGSGNKTNTLCFCRLDHFDVSNLEDSLAHFHTNSQHGHGITQSHNTQLQNAVKI